MHRPDRQLLLYGFTTNVVESEQPLLAAEDLPVGWDAAADSDPPYDGAPLPGGGARLAVQLAASTWLGFPL